MKILQINLKKYMPTILSFLACGGVVGTAVLAVKNHEKAKEQMVETINFYANENKNEPYLSTKKDADIPKKEKFMIYAKAHIPTALMGMGTMVCILGSNTMNKNMQTGLISAYGLINESFQDYRNKVIEFHGVEEHKRILDSIAAEKANPPYISAVGAFTAPSLNGCGLDKNDTQILFYDSFSRRYFVSTLAAVIQAEYHVNRNWCLGEVVTLNEWYEFLGLEQTIEGNELGWFMGAEDECFWLDFDHEVRYLDDNTPYVLISMEYPPSTKWQELW